MPNNPQAKHFVEWARKKADAYINSPKYSGLPYVIVYPWEGSPHVIVDGRGTWEDCVGDRYERWIWKTNMAFPVVVFMKTDKHPRGWVAIAWRLPSNVD